MGDATAARKRTRSKCGFAATSVGRVLASSKFRVHQVPQGSVVIEGSAVYSVHALNNIYKLNS